MNSCLDLEILDELAEIMGDDMVMLLESFFSDSQTKLDALAKMNWQTEQDAIFKMAHSLKGSSRNVGIIGFSDRCEVIEKMARENLLSEEDFNLERLNALYQRAAEELKSRYL